MNKKRIDLIKKSWAMYNNLLDLYDTVSVNRDNKEGMYTQDQIVEVVEKITIEYCKIAYLIKDVIQEDIAIGCAIAMLPKE